MGKEKKKLKYKRPCSLEFNLSYFTVPIIFQSFIYLFPSVHNKWSVLYYRFIERHSSNKQYIQRIFIIRSNGNVFAVIFEYYQVLFLDRCLIFTKKTIATNNIRKGIKIFRNWLTTSESGCRVKCKYKIGVKVLITAIVS